jgi:hypothetical protein
MIYLLLGLVLTVLCLTILLISTWERRTAYRIAKQDLSVEVDHDLDDLIFQIGVDEQKHVVYHETIQ